MEAVQSLKSARLSKWDVQALCAALEREEHPAHRAAAAQVLGYHRTPEALPEIAGLLLELTRRERDPGVARAVAFALRDREEVCALLDHARPEVREEAALGVPLSGASLKAVLDHFFRCRDGALKVKIVARLRGAGTSALCEVVEFLLSADLPEGGGLAADVEVLLVALPQEDLFQHAAAEEEEITRTHREIWSGIRRRERKRMLMDVSRKAILEGPSLGLLNVLLRRLRDEESFHHRNVRFLRQVFGKVRPADGPALMASFRRLGEQARGAALLRMAEILSVVSRSLPDRRTEADALLRSWAQVAPEIGLRMYHLRLQAPHRAR
jgi:hypothetical protein